MSYVGDYDTGTLVYGDFSTYNPSTGATIAFVAGKLAVVKNIGGITNTTGVILATSVGAIAGANGWSVDTSADGAAYSAGGFFQVIALAGTVNSVSLVGATLGSFTLRKDSALKPLTGGRTIDLATTGTVTVGTNNDKTGYALNSSQTLVTIGAVAGAVTVGTNNDKTGYSLNSSQTLVTIGSVVALPAAYDAAKTAAQAGDQMSISTAGLARMFSQAAGAYGTATAGSIVAQIANNAGGASYTLQDIVDGVWDADMTTLPSTNARSPLNAIRLLRNRWSSTSNTLTVYEEDDTTIAWVSTLILAPGGDPIAGSDPS